jgi:hypothetical protein
MSLIQEILNLIEDKYSVTFEKMNDNFFLLRTMERYGEDFVEKIVLKDLITDDNMIFLIRQSISDIKKSK